MKVAVIIDTWFPFIGGGQINAWEISKRLSQKGLKIDIITRNSGKYNLERVKNLHVYKIGPKSSGSNFVSKILFLARSFRFVYKRNYDVYHAYVFLPAITAKLLMLTKKRPAVLSIFGTSIDSDLPGTLRKLMESVILLKIKYSAQIADSRDLFKFNNINQDIIYVPNAVDFSAFDRIHVNKYKQPTIITVARLHPQKNLINLVKAIETVQKRIPQIQLLIVGDGPQKDKIKKQIQELKLNKDVKLLGEISGTKLIKLYKSSHLFILPSLYEGQPISLLDAWAAKLPVIISKTGDCQYLVKNGVNGYIINNQQNPKNIARSIIEAFGNKNLENLGLNGYKFVKKNFSWDKSAQETLLVYKNVI